MSKVTFINTNNLKIARENLGLSTLDASKKITSSKKDLVSEWESRDSVPTWSQLNRLAKVYNIPELLLTSKNEIEKNKSIPDYRVGVKNNGGVKVKKLINTVISRQRWLERKLKEEGYSKNKLQGSARDIRDPKKLADLIRSKLAISIEEIKSIRGAGSKKKTLNYLIGKAEAHNVFVGKTISYHNLEVEDLRGLFVSNDYCPYIVLNRRDAVSAQIFSLVHEIAHLFRKTDSISNSLEFRTTGNGVNTEEIFCNKVAAELLLPQQEFVSDYYDKQEIGELSKLYKVSEISIFYRLVELGKVKRDRIRSLEKEIQAETQENIRLKEESNKGREGGNYNNLMKDSNGALFNRVVAEAYYSNKIEYVEAANLLRFSPEAV